MRTVSEMPTEAADYVALSSLSALLLGGTAVSARGREPIGVVALRLHAPRMARTVTAVLAASAGNDFLQTGFAWLCSRSSGREEPLTVPGPRAVPERQAA